MVRKSSHQPWRCFVAGGGPHLHGIAAKGAGVDKGGRHHSDNRVRFGIQPDSPAHDGAIAAISPLPEVI